MDTWDSGVEPQISVVVVDDDAIVRSWVRRALDGTEFRLAGEAQTVDGALRIIERRRPGLLVLDYRLPDGRATELLRSLRSAGTTTPALVITAAPVEGLNEEVGEAGGQGVVLKSSDPTNLLGAMRAISAGAVVRESRHPRRGLVGGALTPRERDVLRLAARGSTNREIAQELEVGRETVKTLLSRSYTKLGVRNRVEAIALARDHGLL